MISSPDHLHAELKDRLDFETLIADLSSKFINLLPDEVDLEIDEALRRVCELLGIDLAVLWQWSTGTQDVIAPTHAHPPLGQVLPPEPLHEEQFPWIRKEILAGRVVPILSLAEFPPEARVDREFCSHYGVKSHLSIPLALGGEAPVGLIGWNTLGVERDWPDDLVNRLQLVAQIFTNALARRRNELNLLESEARLALAAESAEAGLWTLDFNTGVFWATARGRAIFGYLPDEVIDMARFRESVHPDDWGLLQRAIETSTGTGKPLQQDYRIVTADRGVRWVSSRGRPQLTSSGEPNCLMGVSIDITERKLAEESLRLSEARLAAGADLAGLGFYEGDFAEGKMYVDGRMRELAGIPPERTAGLQALEFWLAQLHPDDRPRVLNLRDQLHDGRLDRLSLEYRFLHPTRGQIWIQHLAGASARDAAGCAVRTFGVLRDITERKRVEDELRDLSRRLIGAHEEEHALLARELHDDLTQRVAVLAIEAGRAESAASDETQAVSMRSLREGLVRLSEDIHTLAYQLHPSVLDELGLAEALRAECERQGRRCRVEIALELEPFPEVVGKEAALCLFRVAQEALNNIGRHAEANAVSVTLRQMDDGMLLAVRDDGVGFESANPRKGRSLGLASMQERVRLVNGTFDVESAPGRGTEVIAWVPTEGSSP